MSTGSVAKKILQRNLRSQIRQVSTRNVSYSPTHHSFTNLLGGNANLNATINSLHNQNWVRGRYLSDKASEESETKAAESTEDETEVKEETNAEEEQVSEVDTLKQELKEAKDQLLRSLAEQENIRGIAKRDVENARSFAVTSFAKSLLDTSDNLTRAMDAVPEEYRADTENHPVLATLYEGISMTDNGLNKALAKNGLKKYGESGDKFDPNLHDALFEYQDDNLEAGSVGQVMKVGFMLNERVIRPAEVGVIKKA